jgi:hypothetical protein
MKSSASSVEGYLRKLPEERRIVVAAVREVIRENIPAGYREGVNWGAITWEVPLSRYPDTYNGQPLCYVALAAQKNHFAIYMMGVYQDPAQAQWLKDEFQKAGKKLDMGKSCVRFRKLDDLPLGVIGKVVASVKLKDYLVRYEAARSKTKTGAKKSGVKEIGSKEATPRKGGKKAGTARNARAAGRVTAKPTGLSGAKKPSKPAPKKPGTTKAPKRPS